MRKCYLSTHSFSPLCFTFFPIFSFRYLGLLLVQLISHVWLFCDPIDCRPPDSSVHGISRQEYWSGLPFPSPGDLPDPGMEPASPALTGRFFTTKPPGTPWSNLAECNLLLLCKKSLFWADLGQILNWVEFPIKLFSSLFTKNSVFS